MTAAGRVAVVGAVNLDHVVTVRRLPGPGETVVGPGLERHGGGKGANAAVAAARAGAAVLIVGAIGDDEGGRSARGELEAEGIDCAGLATSREHPTGAALISVDAGGENQITVGAGANLALDPAWVSARLAEAAGAGLDCVLVSTEIPGDAVLAAIRAAAEAGVVCVVNPAPPPAGLRWGLIHHPILTPNASELSAMLGRSGARGEARAADERPDAATQARMLADRSGAAVLVTQGARGGLVAWPGAADAVRVPAREVKAVDATGAGDTVNGVLCARLAAGDPFGEAARVAIIAGSLSTTARGARAGMPYAATLAELGI